MGLLDGKVAIITGAGGGLGRCHGLLFAKEGASVVINDPGGHRDGTDVSQKMADSLVEEITSQGGKAVANYDSVATMEGARDIVKTALDTFGHIDILINNAGILRDKTLLKMEEDWWHQVLAVHLNGAFFMTKQVGEVLKEQNQGGAIVNTSSYAGLKGNFGQANYGSAKAGIYGLTLVSSLEFQRYGIRVNAIAPMAKTRMTQEISAIPEEMKAEQISPMVLFLAGPLAKDVTGRIFGAHGGHYFEYKMEMSQGVKKDSWTAEEIAHNFADIGAFSQKEEPQENLKSQVRDIFHLLPKGFDPQGAGDWKANFHFKISGGFNWTLEIQKGACQVIEDLQGDPTCVVETDGPTIIGLFSGKIKGEQAFMEGKIKATNIQDMMRFGTAFHHKKKQPSPEKSQGSQGLNREYVGRFFRGKPVLVTRQISRAYAEATNDANPLYEEGKYPLAPPLLFVRLGRDLLFDILMDENLNANLLRLVHGEQDMRFFHPLRVGDLICPRATITAIEEKSSGETISIQMDFYCKGEIIAQMDSLMFIRGQKKGPSSPKEVWKPCSDQVAFTFEMDVARDQSLRYGHASLDINPIHTDDEVARQGGLPGKILQGLCTMAFVSQGVVQNMAGGQIDRLKRLKVRFSKPVLPGDQLLLKAYKKDEDLCELAMEKQDGTLVITEGMAQVSS